MDTCLGSVTPLFKKGGVNLFWRCFFSLRILVYDSRFGLCVKADLPRGLGHALHEELILFFFEIVALTDLLFNATLASLVEVSCKENNALDKVIGGVCVFLGQTDLDKVIPLKADEEVAESCVGLNQRAQGALTGFRVFADKRHLDR
jgi:hypothetical protein